MNEQIKDYLPLREYTDIPTFPKFMLYSFTLMKGIHQYLFSDQKKSKGDFHC